MAHKYHSSCLRIRNNPSRLEEGDHSSFYKGKASKNEFENHQGITLLSVPGRFCSHTAEQSEGLTSGYAQKRTKWLYPKKVNYRQTRHSEHAHSGKKRILSAALDHLS